MVGETERLARENALLREQNRKLLEQIKKLNETLKRWRQAVSALLGFVGWHYHTAQNGMRPHQPRATFGWWKARAELALAVNAKIRELFAEVG